MLPIHQLLSRIRWDPEYGRASFEIGYLDRVGERIVRLPFSEIVFQEGDRFRFFCTDSEGIGRAIPLHRVRRLWRNGKLIWSRDPGDEAGEGSE